MVKSEAKEQKGRFLNMLLGTLGVGLLGNSFTAKEAIRAGEETIRNFEIQKYYQNEPKFNGVYSSNNLPKLKDGHTSWWV